jgi:hypothetical protein
MTQEEVAASNVMFAILRIGSRELNPQQAIEFAWETLLRNADKLSDERKNYFLAIIISGIR